MTEKTNDARSSLYSQMQSAHEEFLRSTTDAPVFSREQFEKLEKGEKRRSRRKKLKFAACFLVFLLAGASLGAWLNADGAYGGKVFLDKCVHVFSPLDVEEEVLEDGTVQEVYTVTKESDLEEAMEATDHEYSLPWLPEGWKFESLIIVSSEEQSSWEYQYSSGSRILLITADVGDPTNLAITGEEQVTAKDGATYYITRGDDDELTVLRAASQGNTAQTFTVSGPVSRDDAIRILQGARWK